jgi:hypothetical protein
MEKNISLYISEKMTFKQIKNINNRWNLENNLFFFLFNKEKELELERLKLEEKYIAKNLKVNKLDINNQLKEKLVLKKLEIDKKFNFREFMSKLEIIYKDYTNIKTKRENTLVSNTFSTKNKNNIDYPGYHTINQDYLKIIKNNKWSEKLEHLNLSPKAREKFLERSELKSLRKGYNQFLNPYYFFPKNYNEKNAQGQLRHWTSSIYNYNKNDKTRYVHSDLYVTKLLETFFNVDSIYRKNPWNKKLLSDGFKYNMSKILISNYYTILENTSFKVNSYIKNLTYLPLKFLKSIWYSNHIIWYVLLKLAREVNHTETRLLFKKNTLISLKNKIILSKPLFRHTSHSLIIDLFIYKNKTYKREKLKNIIYVRSIYKYLLGMYTNYPQKIRETLFRPRFFYINLIEPRISYYYRGIVKYYAQLLPKNNNFILVTLIILFLKNIRNWTTKSEDDLKGYIENRNIFSFYFKEKKNPVLAKVNLELGNGDEEKVKKNKFSKSKSRYLVVKNYLKELTKKSNITLDLKLLTLWSKEGLTNIKEDENIKDSKKRIKKFSPNKFSYSQFKRMNMYTNKKGRKVSKNMLKKRLMNFFLYSHTQKHNTIPVKEPKIINNKKQGRLLENENNVKIKQKKYTESYNYGLFNEKNIDSNKDINHPSYLLTEKTINPVNKILSFKRFYLADFNKEINNNFNLLSFDKLKNFKEEEMKKREISEINWLNREKLKLIKNKDYSLKNNPWWNKNIKYDDVIFKSKALWSVFNSSLIEVILQTLNSSKDDYTKTSDGLNIILEKFRNLSFSGGDFWYLMYSLSYLKNEFYNVNRDILISDPKYLIINEDEENKSLSWDNKNLGSKLGYSEETFRPYYRYMIPLLILKTFNQLLINLGYRNFPYLEYFKSKSEKNVFRNNIYILYNFVVVKTLLDLFHFSYRSLVRIKPSSKYYFINKFKGYISKLQKMTYLGWLDTLKRIKHLNETGDIILNEYDTSLKKIFKQLSYSVQEERKWKILNSFVLYFEDILYVIYGKGVILRIWPLKKYILSSYILTKRIMILIQWRNLFLSNNSMYRKIMTKLVDSVRLNYLKKSYNLYLLNRKAWPSFVKDYFNDKKGLSFTHLEYFNRWEEKNYVFSSYIFDTRDFNSSNFINEKKNIILNKWLENYDSISKRRRIWRYLARLYDTTYLNLIKGSDITGIKFKLVGRTQFSRSNQRSYYKTSLFGLFKSPSHYSNWLIKPVTPYLPLYRGCIKANVDSNVRPIRSSNGTISVKVWIISFMTTDIEELLLHLLRIKELHNILSRKYLIFPDVINKHHLNLKVRRYTKYKHKYKNIKKIIKKIK